MAEHWYLVQFKPNSHRVAERNLRRQGFETFLPLHETTLRKANRFSTQIKPLFPGYLFVRLDPERSLWRKVNSTYGVSTIVSFRDVPAPVPLEIVNALLARCDKDGMVTPLAEPRAGETVRVVEGPFAEFVATVESVDADRRIWLLLEFMGQTTRIRVNAGQVISH